MRNINLFHCFLATWVLMTNSVLAQEHKEPEPGSYNIKQATSERAQLHTIAFDGLAFISGSFGADCFFPPGKVADFFGFQYMRDNDRNQLGHNTNFLTRIANNVIKILNPQQLDQLKSLAKEQETLYEDFAKKRVVLISAFRKSMETDAVLNRQAVIKFCSDLYSIDGEMSFQRAEVVGAIIRSLTAEQKKEIDKLDFSDSSTWPDFPEILDKRTMSHRANVGVMTYASELFSWYKGSIEADVYFCPERHGTYFGGFYLKDYPAMGNKGYFISTSLTGDAGKNFLDLLNTNQRALIENLPSQQKKELDSIVSIRTSISKLLRGFMHGENPSKDTIMSLVREYGEKDGLMSYYYANAFSSVNKSLTESQRKKIKELRALDVYPKGIYIYSDPAPLPENLNTDELFQNVSKMKGF